jgi:hypothetical protein
MSKVSTVLDFTPKVPLMRYPVGVPESLDTDPIIIDSAADAVAVLAGLEWDAMTPVQRETARAFATLAAVALHPEGLQFLGYAMHQRVGYESAGQTPQHRLREVQEIVAALTGASQRVTGVSNPGTSEAIVALMRSDAEAASARRQRGGW